MTSLVTTVANKATGFEIKNGSTSAIKLSEKATQALVLANHAVNSAVFTLERLEQEREEWEGKELAASRARLYSLLTDCYSFYITMKTDGQAAVREQSSKALALFIATRGYVFTPTTHDMTRVVKAVFGVDRRRVSAYSLALRAALEGGERKADGKATAIAVADLAQWLENKGGVEEVRLGSKNKGLTTTQRAEVAKEALKTSVLMTLKPDSQTMAFGTDDIDRTVLLVAIYRPNGELEISTVVKHETAVRSALAAHFTADKAGVMAAAEKNLTALDVSGAIAQALNATTA
jgi:hypothetical protein